MCNWYECTWREVRRLETSLVLCIDNIILTSSSSVRWQRGKWRIETKAKFVPLICAFITCQNVYCQYWAGVEVRCNAGFCKFCEKLRPTASFLKLKLKTMHLYHMRIVLRIGLYIIVSPSAHKVLNLVQVIISSVTAFPFASYINITLFKKGNNAMLWRWFKRVRSWPLINLWSASSFLQGQCWLLLPDKLIVISCLPICIHNVSNWCSVKHSQLIIACPTSKLQLTLVPIIYLSQQDPRQEKEKWHIMPKNVMHGD